jgi:hypothetical protein
MQRAWCRATAARLTMQVSMLSHLKTLRSAPRAVRADKLKNKNKRQVEQTEQTEVDEEKKIMHSLAKAEAKGEFEEYGVRPAFFDRALKKARRELARADEEVMHSNDKVMANSDNKVMANSDDEVMPTSDDEDSVSLGLSCENGFFTLAWRYIEEQTLQYSKEHGITSDQLEDTLAAMHANGWRLSAELHRNGIPQMLYEQFTAAVHGKTIYIAELFQSMRVQREWD